MPPACRGEVHAGVYGSGSSHREGSPGQARDIQERGARGAVEASVKLPGASPLNARPWEVAEREGWPMGAEKKRNSLGPEQPNPGRDWPAPARAKEFPPMILGNALPPGKPSFDLLGT